MIKGRKLEIVWGEEGGGLGEGRRAKTSDLPNGFAKLAKEFGTLLRKANKPALFRRTHIADPLNKIICRFERTDCDYSVKAKTTAKIYRKVTLETIW
ncbi:MAG: hypothetical protein LBN32_02160 [Helicobacteraceae bacterium]|nr:hypothetical protein [Helicobacteraceae bacterium]